MVQVAAVSKQEDAEILKNALQKKQIAAGSGISVKPISREGSERIIRYAFAYARAHGRN